MLRFSFIVLLASVCCINAQTQEELKQIIQTNPCCGRNSFSSWWTCVNPATCRWQTQEACKPVFRPGCICWPGFLLDNRGNCIHPSECPDDDDDGQSRGRTPMEQQRKEEEELERMSTLLLESMDGERHNQNDQMNRNQFSPYQRSRTHPQMGPRGPLRSGWFGWLWGTDEKKTEKTEKAEKAEKPASTPAESKGNHYEIRPFQSQQIAIQN